MGHGKCHGPLGAVNAEKLDAHPFFWIPFESHSANYVAALVASRKADLGGWMLGRGQKRAVIEFVVALCIFKTYDLGLDLRFLDDSAY